MSGTLSNQTAYVGAGPGITGSDDDLLIETGGVQYVGYNSGTGTATSTTITSGGEQSIGFQEGTGYATSTTISGGYQDSASRDRDGDEHNDQRWR